MSQDAIPQVFLYDALAMGDPRRVRLDLNRLVANASTLIERLSAGDVNSPLAPLAENATVLANWEEALSTPCEPEALDRRLAWSGWSRNDLVRGRTPLPAPPATATLPAWARALDRMHQATLHHFENAAAGTCAGSTPGTLPFEDLFSPAVGVGYSLLRERLQCPEGLLSDRLEAQAQESLGYWLKEQLTTLARSVLFQEFEATRGAGYNLLLRLKGGPLQSNERALYDRFIREQGIDGLASLLSTYSVLGRLLGTSILLWVEAVAEFLGRLEEDWEVLCNSWVGLGPDDRVVSVAPGLSDPHHRARTVIALQFSSGLRLLYKPRSVAVDSALATFLKRCAAVGAPVLEIPRVLQRNGYGWVEFVASCRSQSATETAELFSSAGILLAYLYVLGATDGHAENILGCGNAAVLVDSETILESRLEVATEDSLPDSVLRTGLLPSWQVVEGGKAATDDSAFGSWWRPEAPQAAQGFRAINTDHMHVGLVDPTRESGKPREPLGSGLAAECVERLLAGFRKTYQACLERRGEVLDALELFCSVESRLVLRPTAVYQGLKNQALLPDNLRSGVRWGLVAERLARAPLLSETRPAWWPLVESEIAQLGQLDIPYFSVPLGTGAIQLPQGEVRVLSGLALARKRVALLSEEDLERQTQVVREAFAVRGATSQSSTRRASHYTITDSLDEARCLSEALRLAEELERRVFLAGDRVTWLGLQNVGRSEHWHLEYVSQGLYQGASGVALFLAALDRVLEQDRFVGLWRRALLPLRALGESRRGARLFSRLGIGIAEGLGGLLVSAIWLSQLSPADADWLLASAQEVAGLLGEEQIEKDTELDVIGGCAGAILGLLLLYRTTGSRSALEKAQSCGEHLERQLRLRLEEGETGERRLLASFAHGCAGLALALAHLAKETQSASLNDLVQQTLIYESGLFDESQRAWPDLRSDSAVGLSWCHGGPGIAIARLGTISALGNSGECWRDWDSGIANAVECVDLPVDHLCCGNLGLSEVLLASSQTLQRQELARAAWDRAAQVVHRAASVGRYQLLSGSSEAVFNPGLFQGLAGVGYLLLRLARPNDLPCVLALGTLAS